MNGVQAAIFSGSAMILLVLALRLFLKKHLPRGIFPTLWCAAAVRLLLPITIPTHLSVWNLLHTPATAQANGVISDVLTPFPSLATNSITEPAADAAGIRPMLLVWLVCAILFAAYFVIGYTCMVRRFRGTRLAPQPSIDALLDRFRFSRDPRICMSNSHRAPLTFGVFRPTVLLPEDLPRRTISADLGARTGAHPAEGLSAQAAFDCMLMPVLVESAGLADGMACKPRYGACM